MILPAIICIFGSLFILGFIYSIAKMFNLNNIIHKLLKENETVIIPGFGAFVSNYKPAETTENKILPPSREISFTQQIRNNDGLLVGFVADHEKISHFDALKWIEKERENILFQLEKGEKVVFENIGELFTGEQNEIKLNPFRNDDLLLDNYGLEPVSLTDWEENIPATESSESAAAPVPEPVKTGQEPAESEVPEPVSEEHPQDKPEPAPAEIPAEPVTAEAATTSEPTKPETGEIESYREEQKEEQVKTEEPAVEIEEVVEVEEEATAASKEPEPAEIGEPGTGAAGEEEKKRRSGWWFLLILIPVAIAWIFLFNKKQEKQEPARSGNSELNIQEIAPTQPETTPADSVQTETDSLPTASIPVVDSTKIIQPEIQDSVITAGPKFYLIGGGFKEQENAEAFLQELKAKSENAFFMGKRGNFYLVAIGTYNSEAEAVRAQRKYTGENPGSGAWVLEEK